MRTRFAVLVTILSTVVTVAAPGVASAAPNRNHGLTISATPNPIAAGQGVLIYGQLNGANNADQTIVLYHRIVPAPRFTKISITTTDQYGYYSFTRADGIVVSNRSWFVRGPDGTHSRTITEHVAALVTLAATPVPDPANTGTVPVTGQQILLSGHVTPEHAYQPVVIQEQNPYDGDAWGTIATTSTDAGSNFGIDHAWARPGDYTLRAVFGADPRSIRSESASVTVTIQQKQNPAFTINSSAPVIAEGQPVTISGILYGPAATTSSTLSPEPSTLVTLYGLVPGGTWQQIATDTTGTDGSYTFTESPASNTAYQVHATLAKAHSVRKTALLYEGVQDVVTLSADSSPTATVGQTITLDGTVAPSQSDQIIYLQSRGSDGSWHNVETGIVNGTTFSFQYTSGEAGAVQLRAWVTGNSLNLGAPSAPVTVTVSGVAPVASLPIAS